MTLADIIHRVTSGKLVKKGVLDQKGKKEFFKYLDKNSDYKLNIQIQKTSNDGTVLSYSNKDYTLANHNGKPDIVKLENLFDFVDSYLESNQVENDRDLGYVHYEIRDKGVYFSQILGGEPEKNRAYFTDLKLRKL